MLSAPIVDWSVGKNGRTVGLVFGVEAVDVRVVRHCEVKCPTRLQLSQAGGRRTQSATQVPSIIILLQVKHSPPSQSLSSSPLVFGPAMVT